jgi:hypothetical protein
MVKKAKTDTNYRLPILILTNILLIYRINVLKIINDKIYVDKLIIIIINLIESKINVDCNCVKMFRNDF